MRGTTTPKGQGNKRPGSEERRAAVRRQRGILGICAAAFLFYVFVSIYYIGHFQAGTTINGVNTGGCTLEQAVAALQANVEPYSLTVEGPLGAADVIDGAGLDLRVAGAPEVQECLEKQPAAAWPFALLRRDSFTADLEVDYNREELERRMDGLAMLDEAAMYGPVDAALAVHEDGTCEISPEVPGTKLDAGKARQMIRDSVGAGRTELSLDPLVEKPAVYRDDEGLVKRAEEWNRLLGAAGLTYRVCGHNVKLDGPVIASLLVDDGQEVKVSEGAVDHLVAVWKDQYDTFGRSFPFTTYYGVTETIDPNGDYGYELNDEETAADIISRIRNADNGSYTLTYWHEPLFDTNGGLGDTYVEVDLRQQHMWVWKDGRVVVDTDIVSGLPVYGRVTYMGCFSIKVKEQDVVLGDVEVEGYSSPVKYWARFNGGEGIHDAAWRTQFGGDIWQYEGSHGCVNVPEDVMPLVYESVELGEAVIIYGDPYDESVYVRS